MKNKLHLYHLLGLASLGMISSCQAGSGFTMTSQDMVCGNAKFVIESTCKKSTKAMSLNACKPQTLKVEGSRVITLPELTKEDAQSITESGGELKDLYVTQWGCARSRGQDIAVLYYSIGGGSAPYSEAWAKYDTKGKLVGKENTLDAATMGSLEKSMKAVRSIMPE